MSLSELLNHDPIGLVKTIVLQLKELYDQNDIDPLVVKLQSTGYVLYNISINGYGIIGDFRNGAFIKEFHIPYYKIDDDLLDQLYNMLEEYSTYRLEALNSEIQTNDHHKLMNFDDIDWIEIYNTPEYVSLFLDVTKELLFSRLDEYLKKYDRLDVPSLN